MPDHINLPPNERTINLLNATLASLLCRDLLDRLSPDDQAIVLANLRDRS